MSTNTNTTTNPVASPAAGAASPLTGAGIGAGPRPQPVTYEVSETRPLDSKRYVDQVVITGRTNEGVTLLMSPAAADVVAQIVLRFESILVAARSGRVQAHPSSGIDLTNVEGYDADMWMHVVVDLLSTCAMTRSAAALGQEVVYAKAVSGYLPPSPKRRTEIITLPTATWSASDPAAGGPVGDASVPADAETVLSLVNAADPVPAGGVEG